VCAPASDRLDGRARVYGREQAVATGMFGPVDPAHLARIGDVVVVCTGDTAVLATGLMLLAFLALMAGLILDTVTAGRWEQKRMAYLSIPGPQDLTVP